MRGSSNPRRPAAELFPLTSFLHKLPGAIFQSVLHWNSCEQLRNNGEPTGLRPVAAVAKGSPHLRSHL